MRETEIDGRIICRILTILVVFFMAMVFCYAVSSPIENFKLRFESNGAFSENWTYTVHGEAIEDSHILLAPGEAVLLYHTMPHIVSDGQTLAIYDPSLNMRVYLNGKLQSTYGEKMQESITRELGNGWYITPLLQTQTDATLTVWAMNRTSRTICLDLEKTMFGRSNDLNNQIFIENIPSLLLGQMFMIIGISLLVFSIALFRYRIWSLNRSVLFLGILTLDSGVWFLIDSSLVQFVIGSVSLRYVGSYFLFFFLPVFQILFFWDYLQKGKKILQLILRVYTAMLAVIMALYLLDLVHISVSLIGVHCVMALTYLTAFILNIREYRERRDKYLLASLSALVVLAVSGAICLWKFYLSPCGDNSLSFRIGYSIFLLILTVTVVWRSFQELRGEMTLRKLQQLAYVDSVTEGNSIACLNEKYQEIRSRKLTNYWLLYMNLVGFKAVNEIIGWERGNALLKEIYISNERVLKNEEYQGAIGQSSFILLVQSDEKAQEARNRCIELRSSLEALLREEFSNISLQVEFSACPVDIKEKNFDALVDLARIAYRNSSAAYDIRSDCWLYTDACKEKLRVEKKMENQLAEALRNKEMELFLQPKVDPDNGRVNGAEALVRWRRKDGSVLSPIYFIPVFERNGMIAQVDQFMFRETCVFLKQWIEEGNKPFRISVNVSKYGIIDPANFQNYKRIIDEIRPPMQWIEFELTESMAYNNEEDIARIIDQIHDLGATCSMDDFGSSYSNLSAIQRLQFDTVKIDRGIFTHGFPDNEKDYQMVSALMRMFTMIGIFVVAEGIDREDQVEALKKLGCHSIQGYYYARPMALTDFEEYYRRQNVRREEY